MNDGRTYVRNGPNRSWHILVRDRLDLGGPVGSVRRCKVACGRWLSVGRTGVLEKRSWSWTLNICQRCAERVKALSQETQ